MKKSTILILAGGLAMAAACKTTKKETAVVTQTPATPAPAQPEKAKLKYPETRKADQVDEYHGTKVADPYRWLEDDRSDETAEWVRQQNELTFNYLEQIPFREKIKERLTEIWNYPKYSAPFRKGKKLLLLQKRRPAEPERVVCAELAGCKCQSRCFPGSE